MDTPTFKEWAIWRQNLRSIYPDDLLEDIQESEPTVYNEALRCDANILQLKKKLNDSVSPIALLPSLLTEGWDRPQVPGEHKINWADMENLLKLYALGLCFKDQQMPLQATHDFQELSDAAQKASISRKYKKGIPAQRRLEKATTSVRFGMKTLDIFFQPDSPYKQFDMSVLDREISDTSNEHNAIKLLKSKNIALRVGKTIRDRYNLK